MKSKYYQRLKKNFVSLREMQIKRSLKMMTMMTMRMELILMLMGMRMGLKPSKNWRRQLLSERRRKNTSRGSQLFNRLKTKSKRRNLPYQEPLGE
jgi:hypothetical protein